MWLSSLQDRNDTDLELVRASSQCLWSSTRYCPTNNPTLKRKNSLFCSHQRRILLKCRLQRRAHWSSWFERYVIIDIFSWVCLQTSGTESCGWNKQEPACNASSSPSRSRANTEGNTFQCIRASKITEMIYDTRGTRLTLEHWKCKIFKDNPFSSHT